MGGVGGGGCVRPCGRWLVDVRSCVQVCFTVQIHTCKDCWNDWQAKSPQRTGLDSGKS